MHTQTCLAFIAKSHARNVLCSEYGVFLPCWTNCCCVSGACFSLVYSSLLFVWWFAASFSARVKIKKGPIQAGFLMVAQAGLCAPPCSSSKCLMGNLQGWRALTERWMELLEVPHWSLEEVWTSQMTRQQPCRWDASNTNGCCKQTA